MKIYQSWVKVLTLLSILFIFSNISYSQLSYSDSIRVHELEMENYDLKTTIGGGLIASGFTHAIGIMYGMRGLQNNDNMSGFLLFNSIGVSIDCFTMFRVLDIWRNKREIKKIKAKYGG